MNNNLSQVFNGNFNANSVDTTDSFDPIPAGSYDAKIVASEFKMNKAGTGKYLSLRFEILGGEFANRVLFTNLNLVHPNQQAVEIATKELAKICKAVNVPEPKDSSDLHERPLRIKVKLETRKDTGEKGSSISDYAPIAQRQAAPPMQPPQQPAPQQAQPPVQNSTNTNW